MLKWKPPGADQHRAVRQQCIEVFAQCASGLGRTWICTAMGVMPLPPSLSQGVRSPSEDQQTATPARPSMFRDQAESGDFDVQRY